MSETKPGAFEPNKIVQGDCVEVLSALAEPTVQTPKRSGRPPKPRAPIGPTLFEVDAV